MPPAGWVGAWKSPTAPSPKLHRHRRCEGLERVSSPERVWFPSLADLAAPGGLRPCRMCALEEVLSAVLADPTGPKVFVTFTSQGRPGENLRRFRFDKASESGQDRLRRVAAGAGLQTAHTELGPVAYGFVPRFAAEVLAANLRSVTRPDVTSLPSREVIEVLWGLLQSNPPELADNTVVSGGEPVDPFELASLIAAPAA